VSEKIYYKPGFKYQLTRDYQVVLPLLGYNITTEYISLNEWGLLTIHRGYCWDGPSGPTIDTKNFMRASLIHDALYQLLRLGLLPQSERFIADKILQYCCLEDGMSHIRAWYVFQGVDKFAASAADPKNAKREQSAP